MDKGKYKVSEIANWFINRSRLNPNGEELLSNMKLQKLLYYAQGCYMALTGKPLFSEPILAWEHGPVVKSMYIKYQGKYAIGDAEDTNIDAETTAILDEVYRAFGQFSAWKLRDLTHQETPWQTTERGKEIPKEIIMNFFKATYLK